MKTYGTSFTSRSLLYCWLLALSLGCGGGGETTPPAAVPEITNVTPTGVVGSVGGWVRFHGEATNDPTSWIWDFRGVGTTTTTTANPRTMLPVAGPTASASVTVQNTAGTSLPYSFPLTVVESPVRPSWQISTQVARQGLSNPAILATDQALIVYLEEIGDDKLPRFLSLFVAQINADGVIGDWQIAHRDETGSLERFPKASPRSGLQLLEANGKLYLHGTDGNGSKVAVTNAAIPASFADWQVSETLRNEQTPGTGAVDGRLAFVGDKPIIIGAGEIFSEVFGGTWFYSNYAAIANTPFPTGDADWTVLRLPDPAGSAQDRNDIYALAVSGTADGGVTYIDVAVDGRLQNFYSPSEMSVRAGQWEHGYVGSASTGSGRPIDLLRYEERLLLPYFSDPIGAGPRAFSLALSGDATGMVANWSFQEETGFTAPAMAGPSVHQTKVPLAVWGGRLIAFESDPEGITLRRAIVPGLPTPGQWQSQRIATVPRLSDPERPAAFSFPHMTMAVGGLDCYVVYGNPENYLLDSPLHLAVAEGSW